MVILSTDNGAAAPAQDDFEQKNDSFEQYFIPLGYSKPNYYFFIKHSNTVVKLKKGQFKYRLLIKLAPASWWKEKFPSNDKRFLQQVDWNKVKVDLISKCVTRGIWKGMVSVSNENLEAFV